MSREIHPDFEEVDVMDSNLDQLVIILPKKRCPVLARPGMAVALINQSSDYGVITHVHREWCIVKGCKLGEEIAATWGEVELVDVHADPAFIPASAGEIPTTAVGTAPRGERRILIAVQHEGVYGGEGPTEGYLIADGEDPPYPVAFVFHDDGTEHDSQPVERARAVAANPELSRRSGVRAIDLRDCGRPDSPRPVPQFLYGLLYAPVDAEGKYVAEDLVHRTFYCRFLVDAVRPQRQPEPAAVVLHLRAEHDDRAEAAAMPAPVATSPAPVTVAFEVVSPPVPGADVPKDPIAELVNLFEQAAILGDTYRALDRFRSEEGDDACSKTYAQHGGVWAAIAMTLAQCGIRPRVTSPAA